MKAKSLVQSPESRVCHSEFVEESLSVPAGAGHPPRAIMRGLLLLIFLGLPIVWVFTLFVNGWVGRPTFRELLFCWRGSFREGRF